MLAWQRALVGLAWVQVPASVEGEPLALVAAGERLIVPPDAPPVEPGA